MDIFRRLRQDHARQRELANLILETSAAGPERKKLYDRFKMEVEAHSSAEGQVLYAAVISIPECHLLARRGMFGHQQIADQFRELEKKPIASDEWFELFIRLRNNLEHYSCEEEEFLFAEARLHIPSATALEMNADYTDRKSRCALQFWPGWFPMAAGKDARNSAHRGH